MTIRDNIKTLVINVENSFRLALFLPVHTIRPIRGSLGQMLIALAFAFFSTLIASAYWMWPIGAFSVYGLNYYLATSAFVLTGVAAVASLLGVGQKVFDLIIALSWTAPISIILAIITQSVLVETEITGSFLYILSWGSPYFMMIIIPFRLFINQQTIRVWKAFPVVATYIALNLAVQNMWYQQPLFEPLETAQTDDESDYKYISPEDIYYAQNALMKAQLSSLMPQTAGKSDYYAILAAGYGEQQVFLREVKAVKEILNTHFGNRENIVTLANSRAEPKRFPLANLPNLENAITAISHKMDTEEDILTLFLTSHGGKDVLSTAFYGIDPTPIRAKALSEILDKSGIQNMVIIISACHAGSFIDNLKAPKRIIIAAAASDRSSFGCSDKNEWTYFGRAYFDEALRETGNFIKAFDIAKKRISEWEKADGFTPSEPQIFIGKEVLPKLDKIARFSQ